MKSEDGALKRWGADCRGFVRARAAARVTACTRGTGVYLEDIRYTSYVPVVVGEEINISDELQDLFYFETAFDDGLDIQSAANAFQSYASAHTGPRCGEERSQRRS